MKLSSKRLICFSGAVVALGVLCGCDHLDDQSTTKSGAELQITSATPSTLTSDVSPSSDPNNPTPDDTVTFGLTNAAQSGSILVQTFDMTCQNGTLDKSGQPAVVTVAAGSTVTIDVVVASGAYKDANTAGLLGVGNDICSIRFNGEDLNGNTVHSNAVSIGFTFVDVP